MLRPFVLIAALGTILLNLASHASAAEVVALLADGRTVAGQVDARTDEQSLWLQTSEGRAWLSVPYAWSEIAGLQLDGKPVERDQLLEQLRDIAAEEPTLAVLGEPEDSVLPLAPPLGAPRRATSCSFVAELANWDADVEPDGYLVAVTVLDQCGRAMAVRGTLSAKLVGEQTDDRGFAVEAVELERWSDRVEISQFEYGPAVFRLPFRQIRPEVDIDLCPGAILQVEIGAFGHGRMAASAGVPLREFNPLRDTFQQQTGSRFFAGERSEP